MSIVFWGILAVIFLTVIIKRSATPTILSQVNLPFLVILLGAFAAKLPYLDSNFLFVPGHDTMSVAQVFAFVFQEYVTHGDIPSWMPFHVYGTPSDYLLAYTMSPIAYGMVFFGKLSGVTDALKLFTWTILLEEFTLLLGTYLLAKRLFAHHVTVIVVSIGSVAYSFWALQLFWSLRLYYLLPFIILGMITFLETQQIRYLMFAGCFAALSLFGQLPYVAPALLLVYLLLFISLLFFCRHQIHWSASQQIHLDYQTILVGCATVLLLIAWVYYNGHALDDTVSYAHDRDPVTRTVSLQNFLTYGAISSPLNVILEMIYAVPTTFDLTCYGGIISLVFLLYAVFTSAHPYLYALLVSTGSLFLLSLASYTCIAPLCFTVFPLLKIFRHVTYLIVPVKYLLLILAGFGIEAFLKAESESVSSAYRTILCISAGIIIVVIGLDVVFHGSLPYATYLQNSNARVADFQLVDQIAPAHVHYVALGILLVLLGTVIRKMRLHSSNLSIAIGVCMVLEMLSYQYWLFWMSPVSIAKEARPRMKSESVWLPVRQMAFQPARMLQKDVAQRIQADTPVLDAYWGGRYSVLYSGAGIDPCFQDYRVDFALLGIEDAVKARLGLNLASSDTQGLPDFPQLVKDSAFMRAFGCQAPKLFLTTTVSIAQTYAQAAELVHAAVQLDTAPILWNEQGSAPAPMASISSSPGTARVADFSADSLIADVEVTAADGAWFIYLDAYHPGWIARVDGEQREIVTANLAFKAIRVDAGQHRVEFHFQGNGWNAYCLQAFFIIGIVCTILLFIITLSIMIPGIRDMYWRWETLPKR